MFTGYQYFVYFHTKTSNVNEKMQKRATKFIISLKKYSPDTIKSTNTEV